MIRGKLDDPFYGAPHIVAIPAGLYDNGGPPTPTNIDTKLAVPIIGFMGQCADLEGTGTVTWKVQHADDDGAGAPGAFADIPAACYVNDSADPTTWGVVPSAITAAIATAQGTNGFKFFIDTRRGALKRWLNLVPTIVDGTDADKVAIFAVAVFHQHSVLG